MIILLFNEGQMCNKLLALASAYTIGLEYSDDVYCPIMSEKLKNDFEFYNSNDNINVLMYHSRLLAFFSKIVIKFNFFFHIKTKKYDPQKKDKRQVFFDWKIKDDKIFSKHQNDVRKYFSFKEKILTTAQKKVLKHDGIINVGVHIRRGDYKNFNNGIWYYTDQQYILWMKKLAEGRNIRFYISSNEKINQLQYSNVGLDIVFLTGNAVEDLCALSLCDYIMGPPSTYSWWASMYGNCPRLILDSAEKNYSWEDFLLLDQRVAMNADIY